MQVMVRIVSVVTMAIFGVAGCDPTITLVEASRAQGGGSSVGGSGSGCPVCPAGYTPVGTECVWFGGPRNGDFETDDGWQTQGAVVIDPNSAGVNGPGAAHFLADAVCNGGSLSQSFEMPSYDCAEPLALILSAQPQCDFCFEETVLDIDINGGRHRHSLAYPTQPLEICLGERAYGQIANLSISTVPQGCDSEFVEAMVDDVDVWPAVTTKPIGLDEDVKIAVCAPPGKIVNGDFEDGMPGWSLAADGAEIGSGFGAGGTRGARLIGNGCGSIRGTASLPMHENLPSPALEVWVQGGGADPLVLSYGDNSLGAVTATAATTAVLCIPRWAQGVSEPLGASLSGFGVACIDNASEYRLDQFSTVTDPACDQELGIFDGGFEILAKTPSVSSWWRSGTAMATKTGAYQGDAALMLELGETCEPALARQTITIRAGAPRPAVRVWYKTEGFSSGRVRVAGRPVPRSDGVWAEHFFCLEPQTADTPQSFELGLEFDGGICAGASSRVFFDAIEVIDDTKRPCQEP